MTHTSSHCEAYKLTIPTFSLLALTEDFKQGVRDSYTQNSWQHFIDIYGTHYVYDITYGARAIQLLTYDYKSVSLLDSVNIDVDLAAKISYGRFYGTAEAAYSMSTEDQSYVENEKLHQKEVYIGSHPPTDGNFTEWLLGVQDRPAPIKYEIRSITELFSEVYQGSEASAAVTQFEAALQAHCQTVNCETSVSDMHLSDPIVTQVNSKIWGSASGNSFSWTPQRTILARTDITKIKTVEWDKFNFVGKM